MTQPDLTGASCPLVLRNKDQNTEYEAVALSRKDYDSLDLWIQSQVVTITRSAAQELLDDGEINAVQFDDMMSIASKAAIGVSLYEPAGSQVINTPKGIARLAWQMTRKHHPELKHGDLIEYCRQIENQTEIFRVLGILNPRDIKVEADDDGKK
jgi:hypothetical protein